MADTKSDDIKLLKRTQISVHVDEALPDLLVVSYELGLKIYKGVLLESTKRNLPCGISTLHPAFTKTDDDPLYAVNQRFAYVEPSSAKASLKKTYHPAKHKHSKMTVRLRPRQVLCSKCKGICNENNENVGRKRKASLDNTSHEQTTGSAPKRSVNAPVTRSTSTTENKVRFELRSRQTLLSGAAHVQSARRGGSGKLGEDPELLSVETDSNVTSTVVDSVVVAKKSDLRSARRTLRRKVVVEEVDGTNANSFNEGRNNNLRTHSNANGSAVTNEISSSSSSFATNSNSSGTACSSTRTIKICYGPQGEGTVLKIPAQIDAAHAPDIKEIVINQDLPHLPSQHHHSSHLHHHFPPLSSPSPPPLPPPPPPLHTDRATRKALKKAKRELARSNRRPSSPSASSSASASLPPQPSAGAVSPARYSQGVDLDGNLSPRHGLGCTATGAGEGRGMVVVVEGAAGGGELEGDGAVVKKRKHKVKHKKRHREERERKMMLENEDDTSQCSTQKLSINLRRLNDTYCATTIPFLPIDESSVSSDELVPDFPPTETQEPDPNIPLASTTKDANGSIVFAGDVVWGKVQGFPWWPAKVLAITDSSMTDVNDEATPTVHVSWYGSSTSSLLHPHHLSNYLLNFKIRYNKKKRGPYKEAIKQATTEARLNAERQPIVTPFLPTADSGSSNTSDNAAMFRSYQSPVNETSASVTSPAHSASMCTVVPPALASPREINVIS